MVFLSELTVLDAKLRRRTWCVVARQWVGPIGLAVLAVISVVVTYGISSPEFDLTCDTEIDADIAGFGVRYSVMVQVGFVIYASLFGTFSRSPLGARELGAGLLITATALSIALIVRLAIVSTLTAVDATVGAMLLDSQGLALAMQLFAKDTLASRWQTINRHTCANILPRHRDGCRRSE